MLDRRTLLLAGASTLAGCASTPAPARDPAADAQFRDLLDRLAQRSRRTRAFLLRRFDPSRLTADGRVLYDAVLPGAEAEAALARRAWGLNGLPYIVTHRYGAYRRAMEMRAEDDPDDSAVQVQHNTNRMQSAARAGVIPPDFLLDTTLVSVEAAAARVSAVEGDRYEPLAQALTRQLALLRSLRARAPSDAGVWQFPGGEEFYAQTLQFRLGAPIDPQVAHERALRRVSELQAELDAILRSLGLAHGSVSERLRGLLGDRQYFTAQDDAGKAATVADMNGWLARARTMLMNRIDDLSDASAEVRRISNGREADGAAGGRAGSIYYIDLGAPRPHWTLPSVVHHELIPGHILQGRYEDAASPPALQARYSSGYAEGWATYAEQLADDAGAFAGDPLARIGYLHWMLFRMARVIADTGIHAMRWPRARAIREMRSLQAESIAFVTIEDDVVRICAQPGMYAAQGLAALHLAEVRARTQRAAGASFDARRFHRAMLRYGPLSPPGLDRAAQAEFAL